MGKEKYKSYRRIHKFDHPSDVEKTKISSELNTHKKLKKRSDRLNETIVQDYENLSDEMLESLDAYEAEAEQYRRTARGHKKRLMELDKKDDFY